MKRALLCMVFLASASEASALELSFDEEARDLVAVGVPEAPAEPLEVERAVAPVEGGAEAVAAEAPALAPRELWRYPNFYRSGQAVPPKPVVTRVGDGDVAVYCVTSYLYEANARTGVVRFRRLLPGTCLGLTLEGASKVTVTIDPRFLSVYSESTKPPAETATFEYTVGEHVRGAAALPKVGADSFVALAQASNTLSEAAEEGAPDAELRREERQAWLAQRTAYAETLEAGSAFQEMENMAGWRSGVTEGKAWSARVLAMMQEAGARDPTNPWFRFYEGMTLWELDRKDEALVTWEALFEVPPDLAHETIRMLPMLARAGAPKRIADGVRENVLGSLVRAGYEPELSRSLIWLALNWRSNHPELVLSDENHRAIADSYAEDWHALMPNIEGTRAPLEGLARAHREAGDVARADELERRADAHPGDFIGSGSADIDWAMYALPIPPAFALTVMLLLFIGVMRRVGARWVPEEGEGKPPWWLRFNPLSTTHRGALAGMLALSVAATYVMWRMALGVAIVGMVASAPIDMDSNRLGSAEVGAYLEGFAQTPDVVFYRGLHHQYAGRTERARALYEESGTARAWNNVGVLAHRAGDAEAAQRAWTKALAMDPTLEAAAYNTRGEAAGTRGTRLKKYAPEAKMLALPSASARARMNRARALADIEERGIIDALTAQATVGSEIGDQDALSALEWAQSLAYQAVLFALILFGMFAPRRGYRHEARDADGASSERALAGMGVLGWLGGLLTPGGAHALGALRPWLLGATVTSAALYFMTLMNGGETSSPLLNLSTPSFGRILGVPSTIVDSAHAIDAALMAFGSAWWAFALVSLIVGFVAEYLRPDPVGLLARRRAGRGDAEAKESEAA